MYILFICFAIVATAFSAEWVIDDSTKSGMVIGVGVGSKTAAIAAANSDSQGPIVTVYDGSSWAQKLGLVQVAMIMDGAISADGQTAVYSSLGSVTVSTDGGKSFSKPVGFTGMSQDVHLFGSGNTMAAVGNFAVLPSSGQTPGSFSGMLVSKDGAGAKWEMSTIPNEPNPRYGSFPSDTVWYASAGMWNSTEVPSETMSFTDTGTHRLSHHVKVNKVTGEKTFRFEKPSTLTSTDGWYGAIYKSTDAGKTWSRVYESPQGETWYFNQISCPTEDVCIAVGEGQQGSSPYAVALMSSDGGVTWKKTFESNDYPSLMSCEMTSATEGYIVPATNGRQTGSDFLSTTDGGNTWTLSQTLNACYCMDVDSSDGFGVASCLTQSSGAIAMYQ